MQVNVSQLLRDSYSPKPSLDLNELFLIESKGKAVGARSLEEHTP